MNAAVTILVVEDDVHIRRGLVDALTFAGYATLEASDGRAGADLAIETDADLVLLDVMMPILDGFEALRLIRAARPTLPVIMVTARGAEHDRVTGLHDGADDYVVKPFSAKELLARVEAVLRRSPGRRTDVHRIRLDDRLVDLDRRCITFGDGSERTLSERDGAVLRYLAVHRQRAVDRDELLHRVWGLDPRGLQTRTVDMHVARLRETIADAAASSPLVLTVRSKGYMLAAAAEVE
ncbi:MAG: response regulator transcription factor [Phycisphaerales bacterium]|nr:response regulator transcription factor [Phycisphaerales bacterium]